MQFTIETILYYAFLLDSIMANIIIWLLPNFYKNFKKKFPRFSKHLPITKLWALLYLILVIWIGYALYRLGII